MGLNILIGEVFNIREGEDGSGNDEEEKIGSEELKKENRRRMEDVAQQLKNTKREMEKIQEELRLGGLTRRKRQNRIKELNHKKREHREYLEKLNRLIRKVYDVGSGEGGNYQGDKSR